jgi:diaminopimelate epimerase
MQVKFYKYHGAGNDFVVVDDRAEIFDHSNSEVIRKMCDRHFGIGADGLILLRNHDDYDFEMVYVNADGAPSSMCGNGGRVIARFARDIGIPCNTMYSFLAVDGPHEAILDGDQIRLKMSEVGGMDVRLDCKIVQTGSPHMILEKPSLDLPDFVESARALRMSDEFRAEGINVNYIRRTQNGLQIRTFERGVEDETLACGTGVTAAALTTFDPRNGATQRIAVSARGGELAVEAKGDGKDGFTDVWLIGPAEKVYEGEWTL